MHNYRLRKKEDPKVRTYRSKKYLDFIRSKPCIVFGCGYPVVAAHVRKQYWGAGTSQKPHDYVCISLCDYHHKMLDASSLEAFDEIWNTDIKRIIIDNLIEYLRLVAE